MGNNILFHHPHTPPQRGSIPTSKLKLDRRIGGRGGDSLGLTWIHLDSIGLTWIHLDSLGLTWIHLDPLGFTWTHLDSLGLTWIHLDSLGLTWIHFDSLGFTLNHLRSQGLTSISPRKRERAPGPEGKRESDDDRFH